MHTKHKLPILLAMLLLLSNAYQTLYAQGVICSSDSTGLIPLNDLGTSTYEGFQGGLYPFGSNSEDPLSTHYKKGKTYAKNLKPLDGAGNINYDNGVVLMAGYGPSLPGQIMNKFVQIVRDTLDNDYHTNPCFDAMNLCIGGKGLQVAIGDGADTYWETIVEKVIEKGYTTEQVQVGWMYFNDKYDSLAPPQTFPETPEQVAEDLITYLHILMDYFPNMKIMYLSGRHYGGFADTLLEQYPAISEPSSYWNNFSIKWLIERQINADPALKYYGAGVKAPFITWGPYFWVDGETRRATDGVQYTCSVFNPEDGYHLIDSMYDIEARKLLTHMVNSDFAKNYVKDGVAWANCTLYADTSLKTIPETLHINDEGIMLYPNPASETINFYRHDAKGNVYTIEVYNNIGALVHSESADGVAYNNIAIDVATLPTGMFTLRVLVDDPLSGNQHWVQEQFIKQ